MVHQNPEDFQRLIVKNGFSPEIVSIFQGIIYSYYALNKRNLPWRKTDDPYNILVSEIMLQQTQVDRVFEKYTLFIQRFPDFISLSQAPLKQILEVWKGLGYNRRAIALQKIAGIVVNELHGTILPSEAFLTQLPGIGKATASAICAFAFNKPTVFIETNIRNVFTFFFFFQKSEVRDNEILNLIEMTLDRLNPREWYWALMDYGAMLKKKDTSLNKKSAHYKRQTPFKDSNREIRGMILKSLIEVSYLSEMDLIENIKKNPLQIKQNLHFLQNEGFIKETGGIYSIK